MHRILATLLAIGSLPLFLLLPLAEAGDDDGTCLPAMPVRDFALLESCLSAAFDRTKLLPRVQGGRQVQKITYPQDGEAYFHARGDQSESSYRLPAAVFIAENEEDVKSAIKCATSAGYKISPRGRRHQSQGLSSMDGYVVIDCHLLCDPDSFVLERSNEDWLLPGQKLVGTIKSGSGCTNAVMLAYTHKNFDPTEGALYAIGTCPSVGITGYTTGGGAGDVTPYTGWGADDLLEVDIVLYNGTKVTANKIEHPDLLWASQGGGGGFGVITSLTTAVVQSPEPPEGANRKFTYFYNLNYLTSSREAIFQALQDYLYEADPLESSRFGGGGNFFANLTALQGVFLGSIDEFVANFQKHGLLNASQMNTDLATPLMRNYKKILPIEFPPGLPAHGFSKVAEFNSYGEAILWALCTGLSNAEIILKTQTTGDVCADLNITGDKCTDFDLGEGSSILVPNCDDPDVIKAMADAALNPFSFFNNVGPNWEVWGGYGLEDLQKKSSSGGILIPKVDLKTLNELAKIGLKVNHFQHGAPMTRSSDATAFPWRDAAIMTGILSPQVRDQFASVLAEFYGDAKKLQGYYNYMNPAGNPNWRYYYFGDNHPRLASIKSMYDPLNYFGNPLQIEPAVEPTSTKQEKEEPAVEDKSISSAVIGPSIALASHELDNPFSEGAFRWVAKGHYVEGQRAGEQCVCKWFKTGSVFEADYFNTDLLASQKAVELITRWNSNNLIDRLVKVNLPEVWTFDDNSSIPGQKVLQEPFITDYEKFNSNTGWCSDGFAWGRAMQALSHFTYHTSNGAYLVCDLQGGVYNDGVVLTDPVVMSTTQSYGPTDLGSEGIRSFFYYHTCNEYCRSSWRRPQVSAPSYQPTAGTTMVHVPTRQSRQPMTYGGYGGVGY